MYMSKQVIVAICREYGSLGHHIARKLAERLQIDLYDKEILLEKAEKDGFDKEIFEQYDEKKRNFFFSRTVNGFSNSIEDIIAEKTFEFQRELADSGKSFVVVGRCCDYVLRDNPNAVRIFICGDYDTKLQHLINDDHLSPKEAADTISKQDKNRKMYHNLYCDTKWGDSRAYDMTINSSKFGIDKTVDILYDMVKRYFDL